MPVHHTIEGLLSDINSYTLSSLIDLLGVQVDVYRDDTSETEASPQDEVYGDLYSDDYTEDNKASTYLDTIFVIITNEEFVAFGPGNVGLLDEGYIFSNYELIPGDMIEVHRIEGRNRSMKVMHDEQIGMTQTVLMRRRFSAFEQ